MKPTDTVEQYAERVRAELQRAPGQTVDELRKVTCFSERVVRLALDRLMYVHDAVTRGSNYAAGHRGAVPARYSLK